MEPTTIPVLNVSHRYPFYVELLANEQHNEEFGDYFLMPPRSKLAIYFRFYMADAGDETLFFDQPKKRGMRRVRLTFRFFDRTPDADRPWTYLRPDFTEEAYVDVMLDTRRYYRVSFQLLLESTFIQQEGGHQHHMVFRPTNPLPTPRQNGPEEAGAIPPHHARQSRPRQSLEGASQRRGRENEARRRDPTASHPPPNYESLFPANQLSPRQPLPSSYHLRAVTEALGLAHFQNHRHHSAPPNLTFSGMFFPRT